MNKPQKSESPVAATGKTPIKEYVQELLSVIFRMQEDYPSRRFTLDGRLVGDIGEILAEQLYDLKLTEGQTALHDADSHERLVQIKTTMKKTLTFGNKQDYYLGLRVNESGDVEEIFNGPGAIIWEAIKHRKRPKNYSYNIGISQLRELNKLVPNNERIEKI